MKNRLRLDVAVKMPLSELFKLSVEEIAFLQEDLAQMKSGYTVADKVLSAILANKFEEKANFARKALGKDTGTVHLDEGDMTVKADMSKKVEWDQPKLAAAVKVVVEDWQENPADYVVTEYSISETKYNAWPPSIRAHFQAARTVKPGKATFKISKKDAA